MISVSLMGGLGNQLFQYALGRSLESRGQEVQYDTSELDGNPARRYMLGELGLQMKLSHGGPGPLIHEGSLRFHPEILDLKGDHRVRGYWQCERYFEGVPIREIIAASRMASMSDASLTIGHQIFALGYQSCFIHIRRTDNLLPHKLRWHGLTSATDSLYYQRAIKIMRERVPGVQFFVFSDDKEWIRANMTDPDMTCVLHNPMSGTLTPDFEIAVNSDGREVEDLWLMSLCRHAIIANSSFSWWGAWLNLVDAEGLSRQERTVIAPLEWFKTEELDATDIVPARWEKVSLR